MGMYDTLYDADGNGWQTKAYECGLYRYTVGDVLPEQDADTYQVEILGGPFNADDRDSYATVLNGVLASIDDPRNPHVPLLGYHGYMDGPDR